MILGLDVGGTHTDVVLLGWENGVKQVKVRTDPANLFQTVLTGLDRVIDGIDVRLIRRLVLSTTLTTNAIVQKNIPAVGMIVSGGPGIDAEAYRTGDSYCSIAGAIDHRGRERAPINPQEVRLAVQLFKREGIRHVGVVTKFSTRNPTQELAIAGMLGDAFDKIFMGHQVSGGLNFPRRIATVFLNASVYPLHKRFFEAVSASLTEKGLDVPIHVLKADGGTMSLTASMDFPGQTVLSGPAASIMGALPTAPTDEQTLVLDIGGTTTDMAVLIDGVPLLEPVGIRLGGFQTLIRSLQTQSIGIGGDSAVEVAGGELKVGPRRKGPPIAYGGHVPTPTDALMVLNPQTGEAAVERARQGLQTLADSLGQPLDEVAGKVVELTCGTILRNAAEMVDQINRRPVYTIHELQERRRIQPQRIMVLGGPAPEFVAPLRITSGLPVTVVPRWQVANAIGAALARTTCAVTLTADTELGLVSAPEEGFRQSAPSSYTQAEALTQAYALLRAKARSKGALGEEEPALETVEAQQFNMVRGFNTTGKNIRVKVQIKPGLIDHRELLSAPE